MRRVLARTLLRTRVPGIKKRERDFGRAQVGVLEPASTAVDRGEDRLDHLVGRARAQTHRVDPVEASPSLELEDSAQDRVARSQLRASATLVNPRALAGQQVHGLEATAGVDLEHLPDRQTSRPPRRELASLRRR